MTPSGSRAAGVKEVAARAGVSFGTVSNVLNRPEVVSERTRARVEAAMADLGFVRNEWARQLRAGQSSVVAYVMLDAANPFFTDVARGVEEVLEGAGLSLFICDTHESRDRESADQPRLEQLRVQGVLITPVDGDDAALAALIARGPPVVVVDRGGEEGRGCSVDVDDELGGRLAAEHLLDLGHTRIAFIGGPDHLGQVRDRRKGVSDAMRDAGRPADDLTVVGTTALTVAEGREAGGRIAGIPSARRPTAAVCGNDLVALGLLQRCVELGLRVPEDLAIVGYDDIEFAAAAAVPLTSVRQPRLDLGRTAAHLLMDEATNPDHRHEHRRFIPELVVRASTRG
jgi:LacI family transcriptional regulator